MADQDNTKQNHTKVSGVANGVKDSFTLKISNINPTTSKETLSQLFKITVQPIKVAGKPSYGYANYTSKGEMENGLQHHNTTLDGSQICVKVHKSGADQHVEAQETVVKSSDTKQFSIKISNINPMTSEETLSQLFKAKVYPKKVAGKPSYAYVNYTLKAEMENGLQHDNTILDGSQIQVRVCKSGANQHMEEQKTVVKSFDTKQFSIKISNINPNTTQETLSQLFKIPVNLKTVPGNPSYAYANYDTFKGMDDALKHNNTLIDDYRIKVKGVNKSRSLSQSQNEDLTMSSALHNFFLKKMVKNIEAFKAKGGNIHWKNDILTCTAPDTDTLAHFREQSVACLDEQCIPLSPDKWNQFMSLRPDGSSLFKQLVRPFRSNPNIIIEPVMSTLEVVCVGLKVAVRDAKLALLPELYKELSVDGAKLLFVLKFLSQVQNEILKEHGVTIQGFQEGSTKLTLSGNNNGIYESYCKLRDIFNQHVVIKSTCVGQLIPSAQKRLDLENLPAVLCVQNENGTVCYADYHSNTHYQIEILICGVGNVPNQVATILSQPTQRELIFASADVLHKVKSLPECSFNQLFQNFGVFIQENAFKPGLLIQGYIQTEVNEAFSVLSRAACRFPTCSYTKKFTYSCHPKYKSQMEENVTKPLQDRLQVWFSINDLIKPSLPPVKSSPSNGNKVSFEILVQSNSVEDFNLACKELEQVKPQHKFCSWSKDEYNVLSKETKKEMKTIECSNHVCINFIDKKHAVKIYGLNSAEISSTEFQLRNCVQLKLEVKSSVSVTRYQSLFLRKKYNATLKGFCSVSFPTSSDFQNGAASLYLKGSKAKVELARESINEAINNLKVQEMKFRHDGYGEMWKRKWFEVRTRQENTYDVIVNVYMVLDKKDTNYKTPADMGGTVELAVIGTDCDVVSKVESYIKDIGTALLRKTETATKAQLKAVLEGLKSKDLKLRQDHNTEVVVDMEKLTLEFIVPNGSVEDLDAACSTLMEYVQGVVIYKETIVVNNPGLIVLLQKKNHWQQIVAIAKHHSVIVKLVQDQASNGIDIRGKSDDISNARKSIKDKLQNFLMLMEKRKVLVDIFISPILTSPIFETVMCKFKQERSIIVSQAKCNTVYSTDVKTPSNSLAIDICVGNILTETSDAIVNVTNCNLQHSDGLAKELINAGGSIIQEECDNHVKKHGLVKPCEAVCLGSGDLKCGKIIHCVPPQWINGQNGKADVCKTIANCLSCAEECLTGTLLLPLFPCEVSKYAEASMKAVLSLCGDGSIKFLSLVKFIMPTIDTAKEFSKQLQVLQSNGSVDASNSTSTFDWFWKNELDSFEPYGASISALLSQQYLRSPTCQLSIKGNNYTVDFSKMVQINNITQKSRCIERRPLEKNTQAIWKYENDQGQMDLYTQEQSQGIEAMYQHKTPSEMRIGQWRYTFNFDSNPMMQINVNTKRSRHICRTSCKVDDSVAIMETSDQAEVTILGPKEALDKAECEIKRFFESNMVSEEIPLSAPLPANVIDTVCKKHIVKSSGLSSSKVMLKGLESNVAKATSAIKDILLQDCNKAETYPDEWEPQGDESLELKPLIRNSPEWSKVAQQFLATLQSANVVKIERIQNKWLWEKYYHHSERMKRKNQGVTNEKLLFHGTRNTPPNCIYQDEEGFDMRFSNQGLWGNGNYFAVNASYSHSYAHHSSDGTRQMFLAKVLTGYSVNLNSDRSLRMPPVRKRSEKGGDMRYDTVTGVTGGSQVFIAYSNDKAYPFYLISYK